MIDYRKLVIACELALKADRAIKYIFGNSIANTPCHQFYIQNYTEEERCEDIDDVIKKLTGLTQPEPKYKVGDTVWAISDPENVPLMLKVSKCFISDIHHKRCYEFTNSFKARLEEDCYPSRESLIESQIKYWQNYIFREIDND